MVQDKQTTDQGNGNKSQVKLTDLLADDISSESRSYLSKVQWAKIFILSGLFIGLNYWQLVLP